MEKTKSVLVRRKGKYIEIDEQILRWRKRRLKAAQRAKKLAAKAEVLDTMEKARRMALNVFGGDSDDET